MKDLLIEILVEEIPADFAYPASLSFKKIIEETLKNNPNNKDDISKSSTYEKEEMYESLIIGGFIIGIAVGFVTENFSFGLGGSFIGMGIGYILEYTKVQGILKKFQK